MKHPYSPTNTAYKHDIDTYTGRVLTPEITIFQKVLYDIAPNWGIWRLI